MINAIGIAVGKYPNLVDAGELSRERLPLIRRSGRWFWIAVVLASAAWRTSSGNPR